MDGQNAFCFPLDGGPVYVVHFSRINLLNLQIGQVTKFDLLVSDSDGFWVVTNHSLAKILMKVILAEPSNLSPALLSNCLSCCKGTSQDSSIFVPGILHGDTTVNSKHSRDLGQPFWKSVAEPCRNGLGALPKKILCNSTGIFKDSK